jgi:hypothetical protein
LRWHVEHSSIASIASIASVASIISHAHFLHSAVLAAMLGAMLAMRGTFANARHHLTRDAGALLALPSGHLPCHQEMDHCHHFARPLGNAGNAAIASIASIASIAGRRQCLAMLPALDSQWTWNPNRHVDLQTAISDLQIDCRSADCHTI